MSPQPSRSGAGGSPGPTRSPTLYCLPREFVSENPRERLLSGALDAVVRHGYSATSVEHIIKAAGVSRTTFYKRFVGKEDCVLATYDLIVDWLTAAIEPALARSEGWVEGVGAGVETALSLLALDPRLARLCGIEALFGDPATLARHEATLERLAAPLRAGRAHCAWGADLPQRLEQTLIGGAIWLTAYRARRDGGASLTELAPELTYFLLVPYLGMEGARNAVGPEKLSPQPTASAG